MGANQGLNANQYAQWMLDNAAQNQFQIPEVALATRIPLQQKMWSKIDKLIDQLPIKVCASIDKISYFATDNHIMISFSNGKVILFDDVDSFPSDLHVARIALECPRYDTGRKG